MQFKFEMFVELQNKIQQIVCLDDSEMCATIDGLTFDEGGVNVSTSEYYRGDTDYQSDYYTWQELENDIEFFQNKFTERANEKKRKQLEQEQERVENQLKADEREFERLRQKLGK